MKRYAAVLKVKSGKFEEYKFHHDNIWPEVRAGIEKANIHNYSIFFRDDMLISYFEYMGDNFEGDIKKADEDPKCLEWQELMKSIQEPVDFANDGEWWCEFEEVFHVE